jgi:hypothetical protein
VRASFVTVTESSAKERDPAATERASRDEEAEGGGPACGERILVVLSFLASAPSRTRS